jgi:lipoyl(octanoyl) transferase
LEEAIILTLAEYGIIGDRYDGYTGVWIDPDKSSARKICAMGVRCSRWVTMHGFAFNINTDLDYFKHIIPCGINNKDITSMQRELGYPVDFEEASNKLKANIAKQFDFKFS